MIYLEYNVAVFITSYHLQRDNYSIRYFRILIKLIYSTAYLEFYHGGLYEPSTLKESSIKRDCIFGMGLFMKKLILLLAALTSLLAFTELPQEEKQSQGNKEASLLNESATTPCERKTFPLHYEGSGICTGNLPLSIDLPTIGFSLVYNSMAAFNNSTLNGTIGSAWDLSFEHHIVESGNDLIVKQAGKYEEKYIKDLDEVNTWRAANRAIKGKIVKTGAEFNHHFGEGQVNNYKLIAGRYFLNTSSTYGVGKLAYFRNATTGNIESIADSLGNAIRFTYSRNKLAYITNPRGGAYLLTYTNDGLSSVTWPDGKKYVIGYAGAKYLVTSFTSPGNHPVSISYYNRGEVAKVVPLIGKATQYAYSSTSASATTGEDPIYEETFASGKLVKLKQDRMETVYERYAGTDARANRVKRMVTGLGSETSYDYYIDVDNAGLVNWSKTSRKGQTADKTSWKSIYTYNKNSYPTQLTQWFPRSGGQAISQKTYVYQRDTADRILSISQSSGTGTATVFTRDSLGKIQKVQTKLKDAVLAEQTFDGEGRILASVNNLTGESGSWAYPDMKTVSYTEPYGEVVTISKDNYGSPTKIKAALSGMEVGRAQPTNMSFFKEEYTLAPSGRRISKVTDITYPTSTSYKWKTTVTSTGAPTTLAMMSLDETARASGGFETAQSLDDLYLNSTSDSGTTGECEGDSDGSGDCSSGDCDKPDEDCAADANADCDGDGEKNSEDDDCTNPEGDCDKDGKKNSEDCAAGKCGDGSTDTNCDGNKDSSSSSTSSSSSASSVVDAF